MDITRENIDAVTALLKVKIPSGEYFPKVEKALKEQSRRIRMNGFRQGHVPVGLVKKMYGREILLDEVNGLLRESMEKYFKDNKLEILAEPMLREDELPPLDVDRPADLQFVYEIGLVPGIQVALAPKHKFTRYRIQADDALLDEHISSLCKRHGKLAPAAVPEAGCYLDAEWQEAGEGDSVKENGLASSGVFPLSFFKDTSLRDVIVRTGTDASHFLTLDEAFDTSKTEVAEDILHVEPERLAQSGRRFRMTVRRFYDLQPAALDQGLFDAVLGKDIVKTEAEFRGKLRERISGYYEEVSAGKLYSDMLRKVVRDASVKLPDAFLKKWISKNSKEPLAGPDLEQHYAEYAGELRERLVVEKILEEKGIRITGEDIERYADTYIREKLLSYLGDSVPVDENFMAEYKKKFLSDRSFVQQAVEKISREKVSAVFLETFQVEDKPVSRDEFIALGKEKKDAGFFNLTSLKDKLKLWTAKTSS